MILFLRLYLRPYSSTRSQCPGAWKHRSGHAQFLLHLPAPEHLLLKSPLCEHTLSPAQPPKAAVQAQFHSHRPAQGVAPPEVARVLQPGHPSARCLQPALRLLCVALQGPYGKQECGPAGAKWWDGFICPELSHSQVFLLSHLTVADTGVCFSLSSPCHFSRLTDSAGATERHSFLGFASFLAQLGPHPFLPELLGVVSLRAPLVTVMEEMENRDLLSFLWRCRQVGSVKYTFLTQGILLQCL